MIAKPHEKYWWSAVYLPVFRSRYMDLLNKPFAGVLVSDASCRKLIPVDDKSEVDRG